jgi:hypothetical protein
MEGVLMLVSLAAVPLALTLRKVKVGARRPTWAIKRSDKESTHEYSWNIQIKAHIRITRLSAALIRECVSEMTLQIEDYALIGDCKTAALVGRDGSIDWLCWPRFDSAACFAALLGTPDNGRWLVAPMHPPLGVRRRYRPGTLVLETEFQTETGCAAIVDFMPPADGADLVRIVIGRSGRVAFQT